MHAARITVICDALVRIEESPHGRFCDWPTLFAIHGPGGNGACPTRSVHTTALSPGGPPLRVQTRNFRLTLTPDGRPLGPSNLRVCIPHDHPPPDVPLEDGAVLWTPGLKPRHNLGGTVETLDGVRAAVDLGHGLLARDGWGLVDDSHGFALIDGWPHSRHELGLDGNSDWYLFAYGGDYAAGLKALGEIAGEVPLPRRYALGSWYSRYWPYTSAEFRGIVAEYDRHGYPLDVMVLDMDWHREGWTGWSWNRDLLPDAEDLLAWMHEQGLAVTLNLHPADGVGPHEDAYPAFMRALGQDPGLKARVPFDAGDRAYMESLFSRVHRPLEFPPKHPRSGVDFWWLDWQQDRFTRSRPGLSNLRWLNELYSRHTLGREIPSADAPHGARRRLSRSLSFSRWGGWGDHRNPIHFSGDTHTGWPLLQFIIPFSVTAGNVGCFYWSHDIGGHFGPRLEETTARWVQFGALSAALRLHSARSSVLDRRPWTYEERFERSMHTAFTLRASLIPYIYTCAAEATRTMAPLLRAMYWHHSREQAAYECPRQFMLGPDLLAAPVVAPGLGERCVGTQRVWFPSGVAWYNWFTAERHAENGESIVAADIDEIPLFAPGGTPIPMQPPASRPCNDAPSTLVVRIFPGEEGQLVERTLYEDDGVSTDYQDGLLASTPLRAEWSCGERAGSVRMRLQIGPCRGDFVGLPRERSFRIELAGADRVTNVRADGVPAVAERPSDDPAANAHVWSVALPQRDVRRPLSVEATIEPVDVNAVRHRVRTRHLDAALGSAPASSLKHGVMARIRAMPRDAERSRAQALAIGAGIALARCGLGESGPWRFVDSYNWIDDGRVAVQIVDRVGPRGRAEREVASLELALTGGPAGRTATIPLPAEPLALPPLGLRASRLIRARFAIDGQPAEIEVEAATHFTPLRRGMAIGPFDWHWTWTIRERAFGPETEPFDPARAHPGRDGESVRWRIIPPQSTSARMAVDLNECFERRGIAYARFRVVSARPQQSTLIVADGSDKMFVSLNGETVFVQDGFDAPSAADSSARVRLHAGPNDLLIKASESAGGWGFTIYFDGEASILEVDPTLASDQTLEGSSDFAG